MRKVYVVAGATVAAIAVAFTSLPPASPARSAESGKSATAGLLPVSQVVLFSSGVGPSSARAPSRATPAWT